MIDLLKTSYKNSMPNYKKSFEKEIEKSRKNKSQFIIGVKTLRNTCEIGACWINSNTLFLIFHYKLIYDCIFKINGKRENHNFQYYNDVENEICKWLDEL